MQQSCVDIHRTIFFRSDGHCIYFFTSPVLAERETPVKTSLHLDLLHFDLLPATACQLQNQQHILEIYIHVAATQMIPQLNLQFSFSALQRYTSKFYIPTHPPFAIYI